MQGQNYRIIELIGQGGFASVFRAQVLGETAVPREVALKVLHPGLDGVERLARSLRDEARILGQVRHRAIVHVDELVHVDGRWAVVMEYIDGVDLKRLVSAGPVPTGPAAEIIGEVAGALRTAYLTEARSGGSLKILHRDLKPSNILLTARGDVKIVDFGAAYAKFDAREADSGGQRFGTIGYVAPERFDGVEGPEGDVYSLGAVFYELLAGKPFTRERPRYLAHPHQVQAAMRSLHREIPRAPLGMLILIREMLDFEPGGRPTALEVQEKCGEILIGHRDVWLREWAEVQVVRVMEMGDGPDRLATVNMSLPFLAQGDEMVTVAIDGSEEGFLEMDEWPTTPDERPAKPEDSSAPLDDVPKVPAPPKVPEGVRSLRPAPSRTHAALGVDTDGNVPLDTKPTIRPTNPLGDRRSFAVVAMAACVVFALIAWLLLSS